MLVIGLTGGIASGKSTVGALLEQHGAVLIDADAIVHEIQAPGGEAYGPIVERFGEAVVADDGSLDRQAIAAIVFSDDEARQDLNKLTHPLVGRIMAERMAAVAGTDAVVVLDIPLLAEGGRERYGMTGVLVVDCPVESQVARLITHRGYTEEEARGRIGAQASREDRLSIADHVIDNGGDPDALAEAVDRAWAWIQSLP
ncbi:MAG: dephospho-CoA kinase [Acidimicrobiales bacterium]